MDRFTWYAIIFGVLCYLPGFAWLQLQVAEYRIVEVRLNCTSNYFEVQAVLRIGSAHRCSEFVDEYRWFETGGLGWDDFALMECYRLAVDPERFRDLVCSDRYYPVDVPPVSYFAHPARPFKFAYVTTAGRL